MPVYWTRMARTEISKSAAPFLVLQMRNVVARVGLLMFLCAGHTHAQSAPTITSVSPTTGGAGTVIEVYGSNFGGSQGGSTVTINGTSLGTSSYWTQSRAQFTLPTGLSSGNLVATVGSTASNAVSFTISTTPTITSVSPTTGGAGTVIEVFGSNFGSSQGSRTVTINGTSLGASSYWAQGQAQFTLPSGLSSGNLVATVGGTASNSISFTISTIPTITSVSPATGGAGTVIEVFGSNFGSSQGSSTVTINGTSLGTSSYWTQGQAQFTLPTGLSSGNLVATIGGIASNAISFTVPPPSPTISSVTPTTGGAGTVIEVFGSNFGSSQGSSTVAINGTSLGTSSYWTQGQAQFTLPTGLSSGNLVPAVGGAASNATSFTITTSPTIASVTPTTGWVGTVIEVYGDFGGSQGSSTVTINGTSLGTSSYWAQGQAQFTLPPGLSSGNLVVNVGGTATNGIPFIYAIPPSITSSVSPAPNSSGWINMNATVTFTCTAGTYPSPVAQARRRSPARGLAKSSAARFSTRPETWPRPA